MAWLAISDAHAGLKATIAKILRRENYELRRATRS
jgi:hypothetical protein